MSVSIRMNAAERMCLCAICVIACVFMNVVMPCVYSSIFSSMYSNYSCSCVSLWWCVRMRLCMQVCGVIFTFVSVCVCVYLPLL